MSAIHPEAPAAGAMRHATAADRAEAGKAARQRMPRASQGLWEPAADRRPALDLLLEQEETRIPELVPLRHRRMLASPFAFYRGAAAVMAADLGTAPHSDLRTQLCGDAHLSNFGGFASPEREFVFDIDDFDETAPGPFEWDVKRLAASVAVAGRDLELSAGERRTAVVAAVSSYREAMRKSAERANLEVWYARLDGPRVMAELGQHAGGGERRAFARRAEQGRTKDSHRALAKLTRRVDGTRRIISDPPLIVPVEELFEDSGIDFEEEMQRLLRVYRRSLKSDRRHLLDTYRYVHMARKVVGVGSVGTRAWVVLLTGRDDDDPLFLQVKEAEASVLAPFAGPDAARNHGQRVVQGQWLTQAASDVFLGWLRVAGGDGPHDYYVRQMWDWKASADLEHMSASRLTAYARMCASTLARAHARAGDRIAIAAYLGSSDAFEQALATFAESYADQNERDWAALAAAVDAGTVAAADGA
jgi:uncharacterized protein (DUF2252 family)